MTFLFNIARWFGHKSVFLVLFTGLFACEARNGMPASTPASEVDEAHLRNFGAVTASSARAPVGSFLLVRLGESHCAVRFKQISDSGSAPQPQSSQSAEPVQHADYDVFFRDDGNPILLASGFQTSSGTVTRQPSKGLGRLSVAQGDTFVECGNLRLRWQYPNWIDFYPAREVELAITRIVDPRLVRFDEPRLEWFELDAAGERQRSFMPREALCC